LVDVVEYLKECEVAMRWLISKRENLDIVSEDVFDDDSCYVFSGNPFNIGNYIRCLERFDYFKSSHIVSEFFTYYNAVAVFNLREMASLGHDQWRWSLSMLDYICLRECM
jgi:hypothetical protein